MKELTDEQFEKEWVTFWENMQKAGLSSLFKEDGTKIIMRNAAAATSEDSGIAYPGGLISHINLMTALAQRIAKMIAGTFQIEETSLLKVCLLHQFSKVVMYVPNDNEWRVKNLGENYKFAKIDGKLKCGERSLFIATRKGVPFNAVEWEAMECLDRKGDGNSDSFDNILTTIVRQANELAYAIAKEKNK